MTAQSFKTLLRRQGKTIRQWAEEHGYPPVAVYRVLNGIDKANFGRAHEIAVAVGMKPAPVAAPSDADPTIDRRAVERRAA